MAIKQTFRHWYQKTVITSLVLGCAILLLPVGALASPYGSGAYGNCPYGQSCPTSSTSPVTTASPSTPTTSSQILLNDYPEFTSGAGKSLDLSGGQVVYFNITVNGNTESHNITIKQVGDTFVVLTFAPNSFDATLSVGQTGLYDVNSDGTNDIKVTLNSINNGKANLTFAVFKNSTTTTPQTTTGKTTSSPKKGHSWLGLILSIFAILIALFIFFILWRRRKHKDEQAGLWQPPNTFPPTQSTQ